MKFLFLTLLVLFIYGKSFGQVNIQLLGQIDYAALHQTELNDVWGYVDETGIEYALVGTRDGVSVVSLADPANPVEVHWEPGANSIWRDLKVWGDVAYITTEAQTGLMILDLSPLPGGSIAPATFYTGPIGNEWKSAHNLFIDENGFAYIFGSNRGNGGVIMLDVHTDPFHPIEVGEFDNWYCHDGYVRNDTMYLAHIYDGIISIVDIQDKMNPILLGTAFTPSSFAHNIWLSDNGKNVFTTDEVSGAYIGSYDVSDPANIKFLDKIQSSPGFGIVPHNTHVHGDFIVTSYYTDGIKIHDISQPNNLVEVGNYDTSPLQSINMQGCWGAYPFLPSGIILASDIEEGLFVLSPTYVHGSFLDGVITDASTTNPLQNVNVSFTGYDQPDVSGSNGDYALSLLGTGSYEVTFSKVAYYPFTTNVSLTAGNVTHLDVQLQPIPPFNLDILVKDHQTGTPIYNANIELKDSLITHSALSNGIGEASVQMYYDDIYHVIAGKWGYKTYCDDIHIDQTTGQIVIELSKGIYDDFSFDYGWTTTSNAETGDWIRAKPFPTVNFSNPANDVPFDCGDKAWVTGNEGSHPDFDDVDNGTVVLISPVFDLSSYTDPYVNYWTYYYNFSGPSFPDDTLRILLSNGLEFKQIDSEFYPNSVMAEWVPKSIRVKDFMTPKATMQLFVSMSDLPITINIAEAAFDLFSVTEGSILNVEENEKIAQSLTIYPNPFTNEVKVNWNSEETQGELTLFDYAGKVILTKEVNKNEALQMHSLEKGMYFVVVKTNSGESFTQKLIKH